MTGAAALPRYHSPRLRGQSRPGRWAGKVGRTPRPSSTRGRRCTRAHPRQRINAAERRPASPTTRGWGITPPWATLNLNLYPAQAGGGGWLCFTGKKLPARLCSSGSDPPSGTSGTIPLPPPFVPASPPVQVLKAGMGGGAFPYPRMGLGFGVVTPAQPQSTAKTDPLARRCRVPPPLDRHWNGWGLYSPTCQRGLDSPGGGLNWFVSLCLLRVHYHAAYLSTSGKLQSKSTS